LSPKYNLLFLLLAGHFLADYPLQGEYLATTKNRHNVKDFTWIHSIIAHSMIQGLMVFLITQRLDSALYQLFTHIVVDLMKCEGIIDLNVDQLFHFLILYRIWQQMII